jgi:hypothetical protein
MYGARTGIRTETQVSEEPRGITRSLTRNHPSVPVRATKNQTGIGSDVQKPKSNFIKNQNPDSIYVRNQNCDNSTLFFRAGIIRCSS